MFHGIDARTAIPVDAHKGSCLLYPQELTDLKPSRLGLHRHSSHNLPKGHQATDVVVSGSWQTSQKDPTNVSMVYRIDMFPSLQAERDGKVDQLQESLYSLINTKDNREIIDRELLLGGHRAMHNTVDETRKSKFPPPIHRDTMLLESSANLTRIVRHLYNTAQTAPSGAQVSESRFCYSTQQRFDCMCLSPTIMRTNSMSNSLASYRVFRTANSSRSTGRTPLPRCGYTPRPDRTLPSTRIGTIYVRKWASLRRGL
jgi:hypothetical protein